MNTINKGYSLRSAFKHLFFFASSLLLSLVFIGVNSNENEVSAKIIEVPIEIYDLQDLDNIRLDLDGSYVLTRDLDFNDDSSYDQTDEDWATKKTAWTTGAGWIPLGDYNVTCFAGTFDGGGYKISNLYIWMTSGLDTGLFGSAEDFEIFNIGLENVSIASTGSYVGGLVGRIGSTGTITNSYTTGNISSEVGAVGGLVGMAYYQTTITDSYSTGNVKGEANYVGGLIGGLIGSFSDIEISNSYATGDVTGGEGFYIGGLIGVADQTTITDSYATGSVVGNSWVGGLIGGSSNVEISNSYSTGNVSSGGYVVGGLIGYANQGTITDSYATGNVEGEGDYVGGLVGYNQGIWTPATFGSELVSNGSFTTAPDTSWIWGTGWTYDTVNHEADHISTCNKTFLEQSIPITVGNKYQLTYTTRHVPSNTATEIDLGSSYVSWYFGNTTTTENFVADNSDNLKIYSYNPWSSEGDCSISVANISVKEILSYTISSGLVTNSYSTGTVTGVGTNIGGLVGLNEYGTITNSFWDTQTSGMTTSSGGTGKTTSEMKSISTFSTWDISHKYDFNSSAPTTWYIDNNNDYPRLSYQFVKPAAVLIPGVRVTNIGLITNVPDKDNLLYYFTSSSARIKGIAYPNTIVRFQTSSKTYTTEANSSGAFELTLELPNGNNSIQYYAYNLYEDQSPTRTITIVVGTEYFPEELLIQLGLITPPTVEEPLEEESSNVIETDLQNDDEEETEDTPVSNSQTLKFLDATGQPMTNALVVVENVEYHTDSNGEIKVTGLEKEKTYKVTIEKNGIKYETEVLGATDTESETPVVIDVSSDTVTKSIDWKNILIYGGIGVLVIGSLVVLIVKKKK